MTFDPSLARRVRQLLRRYNDIAERKMFGGLAFLANGNLCCGVLGRDLIVRLGPEGATEALREPHTRAFDFTGKPMKTMVYVGPAGLQRAEDLRAWVRQGLAFARSLPAK